MAEEQMVDVGELARAADEETVYREYPELMVMLSDIVRPLQLLPLEQMQRVNERMQAMAPFFASPLAYHRGAQNLVDQRRVIDAAAALQRVLLEIVERGGDRG